jgi:integration host factor subunit beta
LTRAELISELAATSPDLRVEDAELIVATVFDQITAALARGERVGLRGFGAFTVKPRSARIGHNPRTGAVVAVEEKTRPFFKTARKCSAGSMAAAGSRQIIHRNRGGTLDIRFTGSSGNGFQPAMVRAHSRACALSEMPGKRRSSSTAAANWPRCW